jgi:hypothetical protein
LFASLAHKASAVSTLRILIGLFCFFLLPTPCVAFDASPHGAPTPRIPFQVGEKLSYVLKWSVIPVGRAVFEVLDGTAETQTPSYLFRLTVNSYPIVDLVYKVRDRIESFMDRPMTRSLLYRKKQREGRHRRDIEVRFDWEQSKAVRYNKGKKESVVTLPLATFDPLGIFYAFRLHPITHGLHVTAPVTEGKKVVVGEARVVKRETLALGGRHFDTYLIEPDLKHIGGVFEKSKDAKIQVWVTADDHRIVVKLKSKVVVGSFTGELISAEGLAE